MKKLVTIFSVAMLLVSMLAGLASAESRTVKLRFGGQEFRGESTIFLKQEIKREFPGINLQRFRLRSIMLVAKSRMGRGTAAIRVGDRTGRESMINGSPRDFDFDERYTWDRVEMMTPRTRDARGVWQVLLRGNIKVKRIKVELQPKGPQTRRLVLNMRNMVLRGENTIFLKQELSQRFPRLNLQQAQLQRVVLVAKSKMGRGTASLKVGQDMGYPETISGTPRDFNYDAPYTFDSLSLENDTRSSRGVWQILLRGAIKVKEVVVILKSGRIQ